MSRRMEESGRLPEPAPGAAIPGGPSTRKKSARQALDEAMSEKDLQRIVTELLTLRGWLWYHTYDSRRSQEGFPDIVAVRGGRLLFVELKREDGKLTVMQESWLDRLDAIEHVCPNCGWIASHPIELYVWRPSDMAEIERVLL